MINPDFLISGTSVVSGVFCRRKAVLNERFRGLDPGNQLMLIGSLVHQLFQEVRLVQLFLNIFCSFSFGLFIVQYMLIPIFSHNGEYFCPTEK